MRWCSTASLSSPSCSSLLVCSTFCGRRHAAAGQFALALRLGLQIHQLVLRLLGFGPDLVQAGLELLDGGARGIDFGFRLGERQLVGRRIEAEQHVAGGNGRMIVDPHLDDAAGNFAGDLGDIGLDERVLGRDVAAALQPERTARPPAPARARRPAPVASSAWSWRGPAIVPAVRRRSCRASRRGRRQRPVPPRRHPPTPGFS